MDHYGLISLLPTAFVVGLAIWSKKTFESLLGGCLLGFMILSPREFFSTATDTLLSVMQDPTIGWVTLVCGLFGSLIFLLTASGGTKAFSTMMLRLVKGRKSALIATWMLGLVIFIDDYLNALTVGSTMRKLTDKYNVSREMLAYVVDSTAAPICVLIPLSTWAIFISGLLENQGLAAVGQGIELYFQIIPFILYAWIAVLVVPLVSIGWIPLMGSMKRSERRAQSGELVPKGSQSIDILVKSQETQNPQIAHFILPMMALIGATIFFDIDALKGILFTLFFTVIYYSVFRVNSLLESVEGIFKGFKSMIYALAIVLISFVLKEVNDGLGLTDYIIEVVSPVLTKELLPALAFVSLSLVAFATGSFWGVYAISFPIIIPLAQSLEVNLLLAIGSVISAGTFGSHACFYGDSTVLSASASGCNNMAHALTQLPYVLLSGLLSLIVFLILGYTV
ncbi:MAG: hypothetical protein OXC61_09045 [Flavobacteriaceae bacterium]|nr:hypothetical protein [Flavobacteriaceae bacterium]